MKLNLMSIPPCKDTGFKANPNTEQFVYVVSGCGKVIIRKSPYHPDHTENIRSDCAILIHKYTFHNIINTGRFDLKLFTIYAPPHYIPGPPHLGGARPTTPAGIQNPSSETEHLTEEDEAEA